MFQMTSALLKSASEKAGFRKKISEIGFFALKE